jgi:hypothetical protein
VSPPTIGRFSFSNRILRPINRLRYTRQPSCIDRASRKAIHDTQEKDLTTILLDRLNKTEGQKDPEAEALIRQATAERHGAPYCKPC